MKLKAYLELHAAELVHDVSHGFSNDVPSNSILTLRRSFYRVASHIVKRDHVL